ncbi:hypothetical protein LDENG_00099270 [Lucifuga dentata]|nr:hypothetical protein LDENG_00099270 [Lucifuga dentata]
MHRVSLPEAERHPWEVTEALSSCLSNRHKWAQFTTESTALQQNSRQIKTKREYNSYNSCHYSQHIVSLSKTF